MSSYAAAHDGGGGGGAGGKFRKHSFRRSAAASTPYERPSSAVRVAAAFRGARDEEGGGGWISRLVDPASRIISTGASRLFSSVFRKRFHQSLPAPPPPPPPLPSEAAPAPIPVTDRQSIEDSIQVTCNVSSINQMNGNIVATELKGRSAATVQKLNNKAEVDEFSSIEQLLQKKTFTRLEFDRLTELLRSRTIESGGSEPVANNENDADATLVRNEIGSSEIDGVFSRRGGSSMIPPDEVASPAEIAKVYMGSRPSKISPSNLSLQNQPLKDEVTTQTNLHSMTKASDVLVAPRSIVRFSGIAESSENVHVTPRARGRSAIYKMSRSPYFNVQSSVTPKRCTPAWDGYAGPSISQWTPKTVKTGDKQVLKRPSSVLDNDIGSYGPTRRIRQKSNLVSPSLDRRTSFHGDLRPGTSSSMSSYAKALPFEELQHGSRGFQYSGQENGLSSHAVTPIPPQSTEMARKILQQLDRLVPSSKVRSTEPKDISNHESPSKLTLDMLQGRALRSMEDIDSSKFIGSENNGNIYTSSGYHRPRNSQKQDEVKDDRAKDDVLSVTDTSIMDKSVTSAALPSNPILGNGDSLVSNSVVPPNTKPSFQMTLEDSSEMDEEDITKDAGSPSSEKDRLESVMSQGKEAKNVTLDDFRINSSQRIPASGFILEKEDLTKASDRPIHAEKPVFTFSVAPAHSYSQPASTSTALAPSSDSSAQLKDQSNSPIFGSGSKDGLPFKFSSNVASVSDSAGQKFSTSDSPAGAQPESLESVNKHDKLGNVTSVDYAALSSMATSSTLPVFSFGASTNQMLSNGSICSTSSTDSSSILTKPSNNIDTVASSDIDVTTSSLLSLPSAIPFGSTANFSASQPSPNLDKNETITLEKKSTEVPTFSFGSSSGTGTLIFSSPASSIFSVSTTTSTITATAGAFSGMTTTSLFTSPVIGSSAVASSSSSTLSSISGNETSAPPKLFSFSASSSSGLAKPSLFGNTERNSSFPAPFLLSSGSSGAAGASSSSASASSSLATFSAAGHSSFNLSASSDSGTQASAAFGSSSESIFGSKATQPGTGVGQVGSNAPTFGLSNSSSSGFGSSLFGSATSAKPSIPAFGFSAAAGSGSSSSSSGSSFAPAMTSSLFSGSSQPSTTSAFGSSSTSQPTFSTSQPSTSSIFGFGSTSQPTFNSPQPSTPSIFGSTTASQSTGPSVFGSTFGAASSASTPFSFGSSAPVMFGSSSTPVFSFASAASASSFSPAAPIFGTPTPTTGFVSVSGNDQMNMEDSMTDDNDVHAAVPSGLTFGQPSSSPPTQSFVFGGPAVQPAFQFAGNQPSAPQHVPTIQGTGNVDFQPGGSFSWGSGGGDKSKRRIVKPRRDKHRQR